MSARRWRPAAVVFVVALGGCGLSTSGGPQAIPAGQIPNVPVSTTSSPAPCPVLVTLVFLQNNTVPTSTGGCVARPGKLDDVIDQLLLGPTQPDLQRGLGTAIPPETTLIGVSVAKSGAVTVDLSGEFISGISTQQEPAVEQVVYTIACWSTPTTPITFQIEGGDQAVPVANGTTVAAPVTAAADYDYGGAFTCPS